MAHRDDVARLNDIAQSVVHLRNRANDLGCDATGPVGGNAHTDDEWCRIDTMVPRAQALALTILEVAAA